MALKILEFFGYEPLSAESKKFASQGKCPFLNSDCIKPDHGACSVIQVTSDDPVICCPHRLYGNDYQLLSDISLSAFGSECEILFPQDVINRHQSQSLNGTEVAVFGRKWGKELPLPRPTGSKSKSKYYVDWVLAKISKDGNLSDFVAVEVQTIDTTGNYSDQSKQYFNEELYTDTQGRSPGYSDAGLNWENVNKRILPQVIYKGHVLRREEKCKKGLFFVCPNEVYKRIKDRLGGDMHEYPIGQGTITFLSYDLEQSSTIRPTPVKQCDKFTTTVDQVALAFTSPRNLPDGGVYEAAIQNSLK